MNGTSAQPFEDIQALSLNEPSPARRSLRAHFSPAMASDLRELTRAVRRGDEQAFNRFYDLYSLRLYRHLLVLAKGNEADAREVLQAVVIKLANRFEVFDDEGRFWAWLCRVARNSYVDHYRVRQRENNFVPLKEFSAEFLQAGAEESRLHAALRRALDELAPAERELLRAVYLDRRALKELAEESNQTYKAVESRLTRLRKKVKTGLLNHLRNEDYS